MKESPTLVLMTVGVIWAAIVCVEGASGHGKISGVKEISTKGKIFYTYRGIPYAKPPVGELRFRDPVRAERWEGVMDGSRPPPPCLQLAPLPPSSLITGESSSYTLRGSEDCLYLNVHTPHPYRVSVGLPVLVYLHGGGYHGGSGETAPPHALLNEEVVLVVLQYRLGVLGFLSTEDDVIPGNFGLKDQTLGLRWVQRNIANFGGDPRRVTLLGHGAGAASAHLQMLSSKSFGLFSRVILQSGTALCPWALGGAHRQVADYTARLVGCSSDLGAHHLLQCLQAVPAGKLVYTIAEYFVWMGSPLLVGPRVDGDFLTASPEVLMLEARHREVDLITGITAHEGALLATAIHTNETLRSSIRNNFSLAGVASLEFSQGDATPLDQAHKIFNHYLGGLKLDKDQAGELAKLYGDRHFAVCHDLTAMLHARNARPFKKTFMYELTHRGLSSTLPSEYAFPPANGWVAHKDDLLYLFPGGANPVRGREDLRLRDLMTRLWANFAATGNPTPDASLGFTWEAATEFCLRHLALSPSPVMMDDSRRKTRDFWAGLPTRQNLILQPSRSAGVKPREGKGKSESYGASPTRPVLKKPTKHNAREEL
ncbi:venom carboxylesterase-6-like [Penaeus chinensis]|uniref:venom carboxylesterase-6-like n=1 Tax=Penaeus chinensis TaxID=139456 RepID=UPI001FB63E91|nr:venom carboxylesterase-6-like [Penaeus chinensis]